MWPTHSEPTFVSAQQRPITTGGELRQRTYETKTRCEQRQPPARPVGEGRYLIADHDGHSHLAYVLEIPRDLGDAQRTMRIEYEASYVVAVRNPDAPAPPGMGRAGRKPNLPEPLRNRFGGRHIDRLREAYRAISPNAAPGVDGVTWRDYGLDLEANLRDLHACVQRGAYRAMPARRVFIPKTDGRLRPLGVAGLEDKILQRAVVEVLNAIYEQDFRGFSYGFRPGARSMMRWMRSGSRSRARR